MEKQQILQQLESTEWLEKEAAKLLLQFNSEPTMFGQLKLMGKMDGMLGRMRFQRRELKKYIPNENL